MVHTLLVTLLIPLVLLFSTSVKAMDSSERGLLKSGLLESVYEIPGAEVAPDLDHAILSDTLDVPCEHSKVPLNPFQERTYAKVVSSWSCRGPPQA